MNRITHIFALCALFFAPLCAQERIMVIADPHVLPQTLIEADTAFDTYMAKQRKMIDLSEPVWHALMDTATKYQPQLLLIPGDLTRDGEPESHALVSESLRSLHAQGVRTLVIPGNHDLPDLIGWDSVYAWMYDSTVVTDSYSYSYAAEPLSGLTVLGIDGSHGNAGTGSLADNTLQWLLAQADSAVRKGNTVVAMCHWQLLEHVDNQATLESSCRLKNADAIRDSLVAHGVHLVLTGHFHVNGITTWYDTVPGSNDSIIEITTGSPITYPCPYRWLTLSADRRQIAVETDYIQSLDTIADMQTYSREWMREHTKVLLPEVTRRVWKKADSAWDLAAAYVGQDMADILKDMVPKDDSTRIALTEKHLGSTIIDLYLFHSEANENERPELGDSLAQALYNGLDAMICEIVTVRSLQLFLVPTALLIARTPIQSLVEDITCYEGLYENRTDDLRPVLALPAPKEKQAIETVMPLASPMVSKSIKDGQLLIRRGEHIYTAQGQQIQ